MASALWKALFAGAIQNVARRLEGAAEGPLLVRLVVRGAELQAIPWEALCEPGTQSHFLGTSDRMLVARGVTTEEHGELHQLRVNGPVRIVVVAPDEGPARDALKQLEQSLAAPIAAGAITWLPPITGKAAGSRALFGKLREADPHILHFVGHGRVPDVPGRAASAAGDDGALPPAELLLSDGWISAEHLAQELAASFRGVLRLVVLDACEGARPAALGSAAEVLASKGAHAVVAHLWRLEAEVARNCSAELYRALTGAGRARGDIVASLAAVRRRLLLDSAVAFSPVVYLRSSRSLIFDFQCWTPPLPSPGSEPRWAAWERAGREGAQPHRGAEAGRAGPIVSAATGA